MPNTQAPANIIRAGHYTNLKSLFSMPANAISLYCVWTLKYSNL